MKEGKGFFTGKTTDGQKLIMFDNRDSKSNPKSPDFKIYVDDYEPPAGRGGFGGGNDDEGGF